MVNNKQVAVLATIVIVAIASMAIYVMANQPTDEAEDQSLTQGDFPPSSMPGLETRPENQSDGPNGPQL